MSPIGSCFQGKYERGMERDERKEKQGKASITKRQTRIIKYAHRITDNNTDVISFYADMNGNLKLRLYNSIEYRQQIRL